MATRTLTQQKEDYKGYTLTIPVGIHMNDKLTILERCLLAWYHSLTFGGKQDTKYMSRRAAQGLGIYYPNSRRANLKLVEELTDRFVKKGWVELFEWNGITWLKYTFKTDMKPQVKTKNHPNHKGPVGNAIF